MKNSLLSNPSSVLVMSRQQGCSISEKILSTMFKFSYAKDLHQLDQKDYDYLIVDKEQLEKHQKKIIAGQIIVFTDTQKSKASILALSGQLSTFGQNDKWEFIPHYMIDFVVGIGLSILLLQLSHEEKNQRNIKNPFILSIIDLVRYYGAFNISAKQNGFLENPLGKNLLDGGAPFYNLYPCKEGILAVGNLQPKFYISMVKVLNLEPQTQNFMLKNQFNFKQWDKIKDILTETFLKKTASEWQKLMQTSDTCVTQVKTEVNEKFLQHPTIYPLIKAKL